MIATNIDCRHCKKSSDYYSFFKIKIKELLGIIHILTINKYFYGKLNFTNFLGCKWSITNLRLRPLENKKIFYFRCVKYRAESIKCPAKCIVELDLDTHLAAIKFNSKLHNHENLDTQRCNQKKLCLYVIYFY